MGIEPTTAMQMLRAARLIALLLIVAAVPAPARAGEPCQLALVLALDASSSVDAGEYRLQSRGLAAALRDTQVRSAILAIGGMIATAFEWSGRRQQVIIADWVALDSEAAIDAFAARLAGHSRAYVEFPTAIGYALGYAAVRLKRAPQICIRRVIDVSGDGVHNDGFPPASAYRSFDFASVTVNGLVIKGADPDPEPYYRAEVLFGPGAFLEIARDYGDYASAMRRKLLREIGAPTVARLR